MGEVCSFSTGEAQLDPSELREGDFNLGGAVPESKTSLSSWLGGAVCSDPL